VEVPDSQVLHVSDADESDRDEPEDEDECYRCSYRPDCNCFLCCDD
jgi:hypothetical protein